MTDKPWDRWTDHVLRMKDAVAWTFADTELTPVLDTKLRLLLIDTIGCMLAGRVAPEVIALEEQFSNLEYGPFCFPQGRRLSTMAATTVAAMAATWDEACEGLGVAHGRPGVPIVAALLPLAITRDTRLGPFMAAIAAGYEVGARAGAWLRIRPGMHVDGNWPALGVAAAVAHLLGLDAEDAMNAINLAACQLPTSLYLPVTSGSVARNTYLGHAAWLGTMAALSAQAGIRAPADALGFYADNYSAATPEPLIPSGRRLLLESYFKPYAAVRHVHYGIEAARAARQQLEVDVGEVSRIRLKIYQEAITYCGNRDPQTAIQAQFSLSFGVAAALRYGTVDPSIYRKDKFNEPVLRKLEKMIVVEADRAMAEGKRGATLTVEAGYSEAEATVTHIKGDPEDPLIPEEIAAKFLRYAAPSMPAEKAYHFAAAMATSTPDTPVRQLWDLLF